MVEGYYCPHSEICPIYKNWASSKGSLLGIIVHSLTSPGYVCMALNATQDHIYSGGISLSEELKRRVIDNHRLDNLECSHILMLNLLERTKKSAI